MKTSRHIKKIPKQKNLNNLGTNKRFANMFLKFTLVHSLIRVKLVVRLARDFNMKGVKKLEKA
jgi:hypothetical protein